MTSGAAVERAIAGRGNDPASTVDPSAAALAANARLEELRRAAGVITQPAAAGLDQGGAGDVGAQTIDPLTGAGAMPLEAAASTGRPSPAITSPVGGSENGTYENGTGAAGVVTRPAAADDLDLARAAASTARPSPAGPLQDEADRRIEAAARTLANEVQRQRLAKEAARAAKDAAWQRWAAGLRALQDKREAAAPAPVAPRPVTAPVDLYAEGERLRLARLKESDPRRFYLETLPELPDTVRAYPSLLAAARRGGHVPHMRLYLLCKALDVAGSGVVDLDRVKLYYTLKDSPYKAFGPRRLRQILAQGQGVFWERHTEGRLWLKSPDKIAAALDVDHIAGVPVALPVWPVLDSHQEAAAAFYAAWQAARGEDSNPISRGTIRKVTGACKSSQIAYEVLADVQARRNIAIVGDATKENCQAAAWRFGHVWKFKDYAGKLGRRGWVYAAIRLPSSYQSPYATLPKGRLRRINTSLHNLVTMGRGKCQDEVLRIYHGDGAAAADAYNHDPKHDHFYRHGAGLRPTAARPPKLEGVGLWVGLQGQS